MNVFDREAKKLQRDRAARAANASLYDYLKDEVGYRVADRVYDINRTFANVLDLGCGRGHVSKNLSKDNVTHLTMTDISPKMLETAAVPEDVPCTKQVIDEENLPFAENSFDLILSSLNLHWVNNLPGTFQQLQRCLKSDGAFIGSVFGGGTLYELRGALQLAETEREGGFAQHISPFTEIRDIGGLMNRAGFSMLTIDTEEIKIGYPSMFELMHDLQGMGESNATWIRKSHLHRDTLFSAAAIYQELYGNKDGTIPATFQIIYMIGWKPDPSQPKPLERGSGNVSFKDLYRLDEIVQDIKKTPEDK
nr:EOG090X09JT [Eulimnadia texana]